MKKYSPKKVILLLSTLILLAPLLSNAQSCGTTNIAQGKPVVVSSEWEFRPSSGAVDGNMATGWAVAPSSGDTGYIYVDLQQSYSLCQIKIYWDSIGRAQDYLAQISTDATNWTTIFTRTDNDAQVDSFSVLGTGRYLRILMTTPVIFWANYQILELQIYNRLSNIKPNVSLTAPVNNFNTIAGNNVRLTASAYDPDGSVSKVEFYQDSVKLGESATPPYEFIMSNLQPGSYVLRARAYDNTGADSLSSAVNLIVNLSNRWSLTGNGDTNPDSNFVGTLDNRRLTFRTNNVKRMTLLTNGFLGIGVDSMADSQVKLGVNGTIAAKRLNVTQSGWADYVFEKDYFRMKLPALAAYIRKNKHLPGVPVSADIQKNGADVGDIQEILLRKIEELTLYIIEQQNELELLKRKINSKKE